jgi:signal transduction histidine kinase
MRHHRHHWAFDALIWSLPMLCYASLLLWLLAQQGWDGLALFSLALVMSLVQVFYLVYCYQRYLEPWRWVSLSFDALRQGEHNLSFDSRKLPAYCQQALAELTDLQQFKANATKQQHTQQQLFQQLWQWLPYPVMLFNQQQQLCFANKAAADFLQRPLLLGQTADEFGFADTAPLHLPTALCPTGWRQHHLALELQQQHYQLWFALDLRQSLHAGQRQSQSGLVRVLAHELRNSLTPMASMTETLLSQSQWQPETVRQVLQRIGQRATRLLRFIDAYRELNQLPAAQPAWLDLSQLVQHCAELLAVQVRYQGPTWCFADAVLFEQLLLNVLKNAQQAVPADSACIDISYVCQQQQQILQIQDHGPGFANPANLFTPFYTTKTDGLGVGLTLCRDILYVHQGDLLASNTNQGALLTASWPLPAQSQPMTTSRCGLNSNGVEIK